MKRIVARLRGFTTNDEAASLVEYGLILALIAAVCVVAVTAFGTKVNQLWAEANSVLP